MSTALDELPGFGHNSGASEAELPQTMADFLSGARVRQDVVQAPRVVKFSARQAELIAAFDRWKERTGETITDADTASASTDFAAQLKREAKAMEAERTVVKAPYLGATRIVDGFFKDLTDPLTNAAKAIENALTTYLRKVEADRRKEAEAEAKRLQEEAQRAADAAAKVASVDMIDTAIEANKEAVQAAKVAAAPAADLSRTRGDYGGVSSLRKGPWQFEIVDKEAIPLSFLVLDESAAKAAAVQFSKDGLTDAQIENAISGLRMFRETVAGVR
ncbi:hypothetical protein [Acidiphilium angustum]|uniref:hypothetical protein n=1 Tax=Acidiphilium angustum TaxID=523 RepID=UPI000493F0ED|nr:hypothetical protein [Acidiphilium angustum]